MPVPTDRRSCLLGLAAAVLTACASTGGTPPPPCRTDCVTHDDGYQWAMRGALTDLRPCDNAAYPPAFVLGCKDAVNDFSQLRPASKGL